MRNSTLQEETEHSIKTHRMTYGVFVWVSWGCVSNQVHVGGGKLDVFYECQHAHAARSAVCPHACRCTEGKHLRWVSRAHMFPDILRKTCRAFLLHTHTRDCNKITAQCVKSSVRLLWNIFPPAVSRYALTAGKRWALWETCKMWLIRLRDDTTTNPRWWDVNRSSDSTRWLHISHSP